MTEYCLSCLGCQAQEQEIEELKDQNDSLYDTEGFSDEFYVDKQNPRVEVEIIEIGA